MLAQAISFKQDPIDTPPTTLVSVVEGRVQFTQTDRWTWDLCLYLGQRPSGRKFLGQIKLEGSEWQVININRKPVCLERTFSGWHEAMGFLLNPVLEPGVHLVETQDYYYLSLVDPYQVDAEPSRRVFVLASPEGRIQVDLTTNNLDPAFIFAQLRQRFDMERWSVVDCFDPQEPF